MKTKSERRERFHINAAALVGSTAYYLEKSGTILVPSPLYGLKLSGLVELAGL